MEDRKREPTSQSSHFPTTQWTALIGVIQKGDTDAARGALNAFCRDYWPAIFSFFQRRGLSREEAEDCTQSFFESRIIERWDERDGFLHTVERNEERKFRTFLATRLWWFVKDHWKEKRSLRQGGGAAHVPIDGLEERIEKSESGAFPQFGAAFDRVFAVETIKKAAERATRTKAFLSYFLRREQSGADVTQEEAARELDMTPGAFRRGYHDFRRRMDVELWAEVAKYAGPHCQDVEAEIKYLMSLFPDSNL